MLNKINSIIIVGGGSSGWMTAAAMIKHLPNTKITLVESSSIQTIGVGESTIGHINEFLSFLGLKDEDWMHHCNATYKTSIKFIDFRENPKDEPHTFHYPFGNFDFTDKPHGLMEWFILASKNGLDPSTFAQFYHDSVIMTDAVKMTKNENRILRGFEFDYDTAYHMDATLFGNYLRDYRCIPNGLTHIVDSVIDVSTSEDGYITKISTTDNGELSADLFIDCTGFKSMLLEGIMQVPFTSFHDTLLNDRAVATVIPYVDIEKEMECVTSCTAIESGWVWNIPLWNRIGTGYVYSSKFATEEEAVQQFTQHLKSNRMICPDEERLKDIEFRHIKIRHGVHERAWEKNVVGIGLANGFIEPLESTGLMLTHECIIKLVNALKMRDGRVTKTDIDSFNFAFYEQINGFKNFISQHYALSMRNDTPYWKMVSEGMTYSASMVNNSPNIKDSYVDLAYRLHRSRLFSSDMGGIVYIAAGMGYNPTDLSRSEYMSKQHLEPVGLSEKAMEDWLEHYELVKKEIDLMDSHYQFLKNTIHK